jgi:DNA-binding MarR family transcriptional regulator
MPDAPQNPFRVTREFHGPKLTRSQQRVLAALVAVCPDEGCDTDARAVAEAAGLRLGSVVVVLRSLEKQRLAILHPGEDGEPDGWTPTMTGRARVRHFPAALQPERETE